MVEPLVLIGPAMAVPSGFYKPVIEAFATHGWEARALPNRGFERNAVVASRANDWSFADEVDAMADAVAAARAEAPDREVILFGHSLGAQLAAGHQLHHRPTDGLVTVGASVPDFRAYPHGGLHVLFLGLSTPVVTRMYGYLPKPFFGSPGARTLMREWARFVRTGKPPFPVPRKVTTPTLNIRLEGDTYSVPKANQKYLDTFIATAALTSWTYPLDEAPPGGNTHHVLWAKTPAVVVARVVNWWADQTARRYSA